MTIDFIFIIAFEDISALAASLPAISRPPLADRRAASSAFICRRRISHRSTPGAIPTLRLPVLRFGALIGDIREPRNTSGTLPVLQAASLDFRESRLKMLLCASNDEPRSAGCLRVTQRIFESPKDAGAITYISSSFRRRNIISTTGLDGWFF